MKLSRRELGVAAAGAALATRAAAQPAPANTVDQAKAAQEALQRASEALTKFEIPMATAPAFRFIP